MRFGNARSDFSEGLRGMLRAAAGVALWSLVVSGCAPAVQLTASTLQPAGLPLRSFPHVFILRGHLDEEASIGRGLSEHLERYGLVKAPLITEDELRELSATGPLPPGAVLVEVRLDVRELTHHQFGAPMHTVCDSLDCYVMPSVAAQDVPVMRATLTLSVRDGATMTLRQQVRLRAIELANDSQDMLREATLTLIERARVLVDHRRLPLQVVMLSEEVPGADAAVFMAEEGRWAAARDRLQLLLRQHGRSLPNGQRARLLHDLAQMQRAAVEAADPTAMRRAMGAIEAACALEPHSEAFREARLSIQRDLRNAQLIQWQRASAAHNFALEPDSQAQVAARRAEGK